MLDLAKKLFLSAMVIAVTGVILYLTFQFALWVLEDNLIHQAYPKLFYWIVGVGFFALMWNDWRHKKGVFARRSE